ncbi:MAG: hypothetical protein H0X64_14535 [Gemmatimonadaceae bacterium]|nr:hypothetical protein [Gemmatimonadaceae bacterium]
MTAADFAATRARYTASDADLAVILGVSTGTLAAWSTGARAVPKQKAALLCWYVAAEERAKVLEASGLPACAWMIACDEQFDATETPEDLPDPEPHVATCAACHKREAYADRRLGPLPPMPRSGIVSIIDTFDELPRWARPAAIGAIVLAAIADGEMISDLPRLVRDPSQIGLATLTLALAAGAGAAGGLAYALTRPSLERLGRPGDYLSGIAFTLACLSALAVVSPFAIGDPLIRNRTDLVILACVGVFFGLVIGHSWLGPAKTPAESRP